MIEFEIPEAFTIIKEYSDIPKIMCYQDKMLQVFINVLKNAFDAIKGDEKNNKIIIKTEFIRNSEFIKISIFNTGKQIPEHIINNVFNPFFTTNESYDRTGLGLTTGLNIIKEHEGQIQLLNKKNGVVCEILLKSNFEKDNIKGKINNVN